MDNQNLFSYPWINRNLSWTNDRNVTY